MSLQHETRGLPFWRAESEVASQVRGSDFSAVPFRCAPLRRAPKLDLAALAARNARPALDCAMLDAAMERRCDGTKETEQPWAEKT